MDQSTPVQNRKTRRSNVLMTATLELSGAALSVKLRNLSQDGALVEGDRLPVEGSAVVFRRNDFAVSGRVAWVKGGRAGVTFARPLSPETVLRNIPSPKPRSAPNFKRPALAPRELSAEERHYGAGWAWGASLNKPGE